MARTQLLRHADENRLLISFRKPHHTISSSTVSRWLLTALTSAGVDTSRFKAHSTRGASTSAAYACVMSLTNILTAGQWSDKSCTFTRFYYRPSLTPLVLTLDTQFCLNVSSL